jgi:tetracycline 7-halogenase / FADH2 O2-dependent halogenase
MSAKPCYDVILLGSGLPATVLALCLQRLGYRCCLLEAQAHPRFTIGESSTPIADQILLDLGRDLQLPELWRLGRWATARQIPSVTVGCKQGFSYCFHANSARGDSAHGDSASGQGGLHDSGHDSVHDSGQTNARANAASNDSITQACLSPPGLLLVPASPTRAAADSHFLRSQVDHYLVRCAVARGITLLEQTRICQAQRDAGLWQLTVRRAGPTAHEPTAELSARFLIDASGPAGALAQLLTDEVPVWGRPTPWSFATDSGSLYGHFALDVDWPSVWDTWQQDTQRFSFAPQDAALHQVTEDGWLWHLAFDNGLVSLGWVLPSHAWGQLTAESSADQRWEFWQQKLRRYPRLWKLYGQARLVAPAAGLSFLPRQQRLSSAWGGPGWLVLPSAAGFIDPLHSTGLAHSLFSVHKLVRTLQRGRTWDDEFVQDYTRRLRQEVWCVDQLVALAYRSGGDPQKWEAATMLYFAAAIACEEWRDRSRRAPAQGRSDVESRVDSAAYAHVPWGGPDFLMADRTDWLERVVRGGQLLRRATPPPGGWLPAMAQILGPWNTVGLCDPQLGGIYHYTVANKS